MNEQRFALTYRETPDNSGNAPGLALGDDGNVYLIDSAGTRSQLGPSTPAKLDPFTTVSGSDVVVGTGGALTLEGTGASAVTLENTSTGAVNISANGGGIAITEYTNTAWIKLGPNSPTIDIHAADALTLHSPNLLTLDGNNGVAKVFIGAGAGGNGGVVVNTPANGASPTFDVEVNAGTAKIQAGDGFVTLNAADVKIEGNGAVGLDISSGGGHPVVLVCNDAAGFLGFFGHAGAARVAGSSITTLAQMVSALQGYGLLS